MKTWILFAALVASPTIAHAETFTFTSTAKTIDQVYMPGPTAESRAMGATIFSSATKTLASDGKVYSTQGKCSSWVLPTGSPFGINGVCQFADATGPLYEIAYTCELPTSSAPSIDCWGKLIGLGGAWKGRTGTTSWRSNQDGTNQGSGQWN